MKIPGPTVDQIIGARIRILRKTLGISQAELGQALDVTFQQVQKYENGRNRVAGGTLLAIAEKLKTTPSDILGVKEKNISNEVLLLATEPSVMQLILAMSKLSPNKRARLCQAMTSVVLLL
jgi:transcriptional regulator with XRE-family HTH domain